MPDALILDAVRTPIGRYGGVLSGARPDDLAAHVVRAAVERAGLDPASVDELYMGCANQAGEDNRNVARMAGLLAGLPVEVPAVTVNRLCASGLEAAVQGARQLRLGEAVELNEAFAAQVLASMRELGFEHDRLNVNGGAIALGHPLGCSGARLLGTLAWELRRRGGHYGVATMCIGVGQGLAAVIENPAA
jgi:acetyl-CoA acetyltransferase